MRRLARLAGLLRGLARPGPPSPRPDAPARPTEGGPSGGILLLHTPEGARISGLGPGGLLEVGTERAVIGGAEGCQVIVRGEPFGRRPACALAPEGDAWFVEQLPGATATQVGTALLAEGRRRLEPGDLLIPRNGAGYGPFFLFLRFDPATRRSAVLPRVERALRAASPGEAATLLAEVTRWFQDELLVAREVLGPTPSCSACGAFATPLTALHPAGFDFVADLPGHVPHATLRECPACLREPFSVRALRAAGAERALAETLRALTAAGDGAAAAEVERRFRRAAPRVGPGTCVLCRSALERVASGADGQATCEGCLSASRGRWS